MPAPRILIIDDDTRLLRILTHHMQERGYQVVTAVDGKTGFALAAAGGFEIVLTDLLLPGGMDGLAVARELQRIAQKVPIIVMTGQGSTDNAVRALRHGAADFLTKPFQLKELDTAVDKALARSGVDVSIPPAKRPSSTTGQPKVIQSLTNFLEVLENVPSPTSSADAPTAALLGYAELLIQSLGISSDEAQRLRWAVRLSAISPDSLDELSMVGDVARIVRTRTARWDRRDTPPGAGAPPLTLVGRCLAVAHAAVEATDSTSTMPATDVRLALRHAAGTRLDPVIVERFVALPDEALASPLRKGTPQEVHSTPRAAPVLPK